MSYQITPKRAVSESPEIVIPTQQDRWVIPKNCELMKLLVEKQALRASDLCFNSKEQCHCFVRQLFLLALQDEYQTEAPSPLATFARAAMKDLSNSDAHQTS